MNERWINPYQLTARGYETMLLVCEARIQVRPYEGMPQEWRFMGGPEPAWVADAHDWTRRYIQAGLIARSRPSPDSQGWAPLVPTMAGAVLLDTWRDHPFTVFEHRQ